MTQPFQPSRHTRAVVVADWRDSEELAQWHMVNQLAVADATLTPPGTDGGIDVISASGAAQVKHHTAPVGSPEVQQLRGAAHGKPLAAFYALSGYTPAALLAADTLGVALFTYNVYGDVEPANTTAAHALRPHEPAIEQHRPPSKPDTPADDHSLSASIDSLQLTDANFRDARMFVVASLAELALASKECQESLAKFEDSDLTRATPFTTQMIDRCTHGIGQAIVDALATPRTLPWWFRFLERTFQNLAAAHIGALLLDDADKYTSPEELQRQLEERAPARQGTGLLSQWWANRSPVLLDSNRFAAVQELDAQFWAEDARWVAVRDPEYGDEYIPGPIPRRFHAVDRIAPLRPIVIGQPFAMSPDEVIATLDEAVHSKRYHRGEDAAV